MGSLLSPLQNPGSVSMRVRPGMILGLLASSVLLAQTINAAPLTEADCDCSRIVGECVVAADLDQSFEPAIVGQTFDSIQHWTVTLSVDPSAKCALVKTGVSQVRGELLANHEGSYQQLIPQVSGKVTFSDSKNYSRDVTDDKNMRLMIANRSTSCQLCTVVSRQNGGEPDPLAQALSQTPEPDPLADALAATPSGYQPIPAEDTSEPVALSSGLDAFERARQQALQQQRAMAAQQEAEAERQRLAMEQQRLAVEQQQMQAQSPPPTEDPGSGWGQVLGAVGAGIVTGLANNYIVEHGGTPIVGGIPTQPQASSGSGMTPECEAVMPRLQSILNQCDSSHLEGMCYKAKYGADCFRRAEAASGNCAEAAAQARQQRQQFEQQARDVCSN